MTAGLIELVEHEPQRVAVVHGHVGNSEFDEFLTRAYGEVRALLDHQRLAAVGPPFARYRATGRGLDVEAGLPVEDDVRPAGRVTVETLPGGLRVTAAHEGDYGTVGFTYETLREWLAGNEYAATDDPWESYVDLPDGSTVTVVTVPCRRLPPFPPPRVHV
ncbi:GyrI-like domain-containing protein [Geodermatophilus sp. SYSU D00815]